MGHRNRRGRGFCFNFSFDDNDLLKTKNYGKRGKGKEEEEEEGDEEKKVTNVKTIYTNSEEEIETDKDLRLFIFLRCYTRHQLAHLNKDPLLKRLTRCCNDPFPSSYSRVFMDPLSFFLISLSFL